MSEKKPYYQALEDANQRAAALVQSAVVAIAERATTKANVTTTKKDKKI
jgi:hypothetical protein